MRHLILLAALAAVAAPAQEPGNDPSKPGKLALAVDAGGHTADIGAVAFTPDGQTLLSGADDLAVRVWDVGTGLPRHVIRAPGIPDAGRMALSPDGTTVAVPSVYGAGDRREFVVYLMAVADGRVVKALRGHTRRVIGLAFSRDGKQLATASHDGTIRLWNTGTGAAEGAHKVPLPDPGPGTAWHKGPGEVAFNPKGGLLAFIDDNSAVRVLNLKTGKAPVRLPVANYDRFNAVAWSPDGKTVATNRLGKGYGFQLWTPDGKEWKPGPKPMGDRTVYGAVFSADGAKVLAFWDDNLRHRAGVFDAATGKKLAQFAPTETQKGWGEPGPAVCGALSADGQWAATAGGGRGTHEIYLWKTDGPKVVRRLAARSWFPEGQEIGWTADGNGVACFFRGAKGEKSGRLFDFATLTMRGIRPTDRVTGPALKSDGRTLERQDPGRLYFETQVVKDKKVVARIAVPHSAHKPLGRTFFGPDRVAVTGDWGGFFLYDAGTGKQVHEFTGYAGPIETVAASPGAKYLATAGLDQRVRVWHPDRALPVLNLYMNGADWVAWTRAGYYAASPNGERMVGWYADNGIDTAPTYYAAEQFRGVLYRPDVIKRVLETGSSAAAVKAANAALPKAAAKAAVARKPVTSPESLLPPGVTLKVVDDSKPPAVTVKVTARAVVADQPIKSVRLLVDGRPVPDGKARESFPDGQEKAVCEFTWTVTLPPGRHTLTALARGKDDTPSVSNAVEPKPVPVAPADRPALHHLAVGVNEYQAPGMNLRCAVADAKSLVKEFRAAADNGTLFRPGDKTPPPLTDAAATRAAVLAGIAAARKAARANDLFVFSFAGHGVRKDGEFFLLTHEANPATRQTLEATALSGAELRKALADFPCQAMLVLDACQSGGFAATGGPAPSEDAARALADVDARVTVMAAAMGHEEAKEKNGHGLFTAALARALKRDPDCFFDRRTGEMSVYHLQAFVHQEVTKDTDFKQTPFLKVPLATPPFPVAAFPTK